MNEFTFVQIILIISFIIAVGAFVALFFITAPYGRHTKRGWGPRLPSWLGWFLMELPATLSFVWFYSHGQNAAELVPMFFLGIWLLHYGNRGFIFPLLMRVAKGDRGSFSIVCNGRWFIDNCIG